MKINLFLALFFSSLTSQAQKKTIVYKQEPKITAHQDMHVVVYKNALSLGDLETATYALHNIIATNPSGAIYKDTLALAYLQRGFYRQAQVLTKALYKEKENNSRTEVLAICAKQLGQPIEAIDLYKKLYNTTKNRNYAFEQLQLEYGIKRLAEAKLTAEALLVGLPVDDKTKLTVPKLDNKTAQEVSLKAGIFYILGNIYFDMNDKLNAELVFKKALELNPDYELAQNALNFLTNKQEEVKPETSKKKK